MLALPPPILCSQGNDRKAVFRFPQFSHSSQTVLFDHGVCTHLPRTLVWQAAAQDHDSIITFVKSIFFFNVLNSFLGIALYPVCPLGFKVFPRLFTWNANSRRITVNCFVKRVPEGLACGRMDQATTCDAGMPVSAGLSPSTSAPNPVTFECTRQWHKVPKCLTPAMHMGDLDDVLGSWLGSGPALSVPAIGGWFSFSFSFSPSFPLFLSFLSFCNCAFEISKGNISSKKKIKDCRVKSMGISVPS